MNIIMYECILICSDYVKDINIYRESKMFLESSVGGIYHRSGVPLLYALVTL